MFEALRFAAPRRRALPALLLAILLAALLAACGGGGSAGGPTPTLVSARIGPAGGTLAGPEDLRLGIPAAALAADVTLGIERSSAGAPPLPPLPAGMAPVGEMLALTPHGTQFSAAATLSLPLAGQPAGAIPVILKTNAANDGWEALDTRIVGDRALASIARFSWIRLVMMCNGAGCPPEATPPPVITMQPRSGSADEGGYALLSVDAIGLAPLGYRWFSAGRNLSAERGRALVLNPLTLADDGLRVSVTVTDALGRSVSSDTAQIHVRALPPRVATQPLDVEAVAGSPAVFAAGTTSGLSQTLQWERSDDGGQGWTNAPAPSQLARLTLPAVQQADDGAMFRLRATNSAGTVVTRAARLTVRPLPAPPQVLSSPVDVVTVPGRTAEWRVTASGGDLRYAWQRRSAGSADWQPVASGGDGPVLTLSNVVPADDGTRLRVVVSNASGSATSAEALLHVLPSIGQGPVRVAGGADHSVALAADGRVFTWGSHTFGQTGQGAERTRRLPAAVPGLADVANLAVGDYHVLALHGDGHLSAWGSNQFGQLGVPDRLDSDFPIALPADPLSGRAVGAGPGRSALFGAFGGTEASWAWGAGYLGDGQLHGIGDLFSEGTPPSPPIALRGAAHIRAAFGQEHTLAVQPDGSVLAWGPNYEGELGLGDLGARTAPTPIPTLARIVAVAAGWSSSMALDADGQVFVWGLNASGQLGVPEAGRRALAPVALPLPGPAVAIAAGKRHGLALLWDGRLFGWGANVQGSVGSGGPEIDVLRPTEVTGAWRLPVQAIGAGAAHSLLLDADGTVWAWGRNGNGQLGDGTSEPRFRPAPVPGLNLN
ncbi:MAG: hypothetical protein KF788_11760 [Piscinibacter sp.]|nr:hypothetical protein [Piscinibacter sp.]